MGPAENLQVGLIARRYFLEGRSKVEIAAEYGISRFKVARILETALAEGTVRIEINVPGHLDIELSDRLREAYGLQHSLVLDTPDDDETRRGELGRAVGQLLSEIVTAQDMLGVGWGRTLASMSDGLTRLAPCPVVQMSGVVGSVSANSMELLRRLTGISGGPAFPIYAPLLVSDAATARGLRQQAGIKAAFARFGHITKAAIAVGSWNPPNSQLHDIMSAHERAAMRDHGVQADISATLLSGSGEPLAPEIDARSVAISAEQLRQIPEVIAVAGGADKADAVTAVLQGGYATSLVTDVHLARLLLRDAEE
jgi:DNA-binding transcriptional regulator LsrR (DeoR family)